MAKYHHHDTTIWRAKVNKPKSAFWAAILKVTHLLISASVLQLADGTSSTWSSPWFEGWENIYDHPIIQQPHFYPTTVKDLWMPNHKVWNSQLICTLFEPQTTTAIIHTPILIWKLTPAGCFSPKSAYKHAFNNLNLPARQRTKIIMSQEATDTWLDLELSYIYGIICIAEKSMSQQLLLQSPRRYKLNLVLYFWLLNLQIFSEFRIMPSTWTTTSLPPQQGPLPSFRLQDIGATDCFQRTSKLLPPSITIGFIISTEPTTPWHIIRQVFLYRYKTDHCFLDALLYILLKEMSVSSKTLLMYLACFLSRFYL